MVKILKTRLETFETDAEFSLVNILDLNEEILTKNSFQFLSTRRTFFTQSDEISRTPPLDTCPEEIY